MTTFRILSLDGGGIRGVLSAAILERLETECPGFLSSIDLFAGTSTGGILALGLASGMTPAQLRQLYEDSGNKVFVNRRWRNFFRVEDYDQWLEADYSSDALEQALREEFDSKTLADLNKKVLVVSFDLVNKFAAQRQWKPKIFNNFEGDPDLKEKAIDVALRTSAAPTYFPIYQGYADGGVIANNPSMCALSQAISTGKSGGGKTIDEIRLLSVGTGINLNYIDLKEDDDGKWGYVKWAPKLINLMLDGSVDLVNYQCKQILGGEKYLRINPVMHEPVDLDDVAQVQYLNTVSQKVEEWDEKVTWVKTKFLS